MTDFINSEKKNWIKSQNWLKHSKGSKFLVSVEDSMKQKWVTVKDKGYSKQKKWCSLQKEHKELLSEVEYAALAAQSKLKYQLKQLKSSIHFKFEHAQHVIQEIEHKLQTLKSIHMICHVGESVCLFWSICWMMLLVLLGKSHRLCLLKILYKGNHLLVANKPTGMISAPGCTLKCSISKHLKVRFVVGILIQHIDTRVWCYWQRITISTILQQI